MHSVELLEDYTRPDGTQLPRGNYIAEDATAFECGSFAQRDTVRLRHRPQSSAWNHEIASANDGLRVLLIANAGFGDCLLLTPALRAFAETYPQHKLTVATRALLHPVFDGLPYRPELIDYPVPADVAGKFNVVLTTEHLQEASRRGHEVHAIDLKCDVLAVSAASRKVDYVVTGDERLNAIARYPRILHPKEQRVTPRVVLHMNASSMIRTPHPQWMTDLIVTLFERGYEVVLLGTVQNMEVPKQIAERVRDLTKDGLTFRQCAAVVATADCVVAPDSSFLHVAGALMIPTVGLFAVVPSQLRTTQYPTVFAINGRDGCDRAPCGHHPKHVTDYWPKGGPCVKAGYCVPLSSIPIKRVVREVERMLEGAKMPRDY